LIGEQQLVFGLIFFCGFERFFIILRVFFAVLGLSISTLRLFFIGFGLFCAKRGFFVGLGLSTWFFHGLLLFRWPRDFFAGLLLFVGDKGLL
jgi:hypothetical protein